MLQLDEDKLEMYEKKIMERVKRIFFECNIEIPIKLKFKIYTIPVCSYYLKFCGHIHPPLCFRRKVNIYNSLYNISSQESYIAVEYTGAYYTHMIISRFIETYNVETEEEIEDFIRKLDEVTINYL